MKELHLINKQSSNILDKENPKVCYKSSANDENSNVKDTTPLIAINGKDNSSKENHNIKNTENKKKNSLLRSLTFKAKNSRLTRLNSLQVI